MSTKKIEIELSFSGSGRVERVGELGFAGGVAQPNLQGLSFQMHRQARDENGIFNPVDGEGPVEASFQVNIRGASAQYRELGRYFLALAELDTSADEGFHEHFDDLVSTDGKTQLHVIVRKIGA